MILPAGYQGDIFFRNNQMINVHTKNAEVLKGTLYFVFLVKPKIVKLGYASILNKLLSKQPKELQCFFPLQSSNYSECFKFSNPIYRTI